MYIPTYKLKRQEIKSHHLGRSNQLESHSACLSKKAALDYPKKLHGVVAPTKQQISCFPDIHVQYYTCTCMYTSLKYYHDLSVIVWRPATYMVIFGWSCKGLESWSNSESAGKQLKLNQLENSWRYETLQQLESSRVKQPFNSWKAARLKQLESSCIKASVQQLESSWIKSTVQQLESSWIKAAGLKQLESSWIKSAVQQLD